MIIDAHLEVALAQRVADQTNGVRLQSELFFSSLRRILGYRLCRARTITYFLIGSATRYGPFGKALGPKTNTS